MGITVTQSGNGSSNVDSTTGSMNATVPSGSNMLILIVGNGYAGSNNNVTSASFNGNALSGGINVSNPGNGRHLSIWYLMNPPVGTYTLSFTLQSSHHQKAFGYIALSGVDSTSPIGNTNGLTGNTTPMSVSITTTKANSLLVGGIHTGTNFNNLSVGSGQSSQINQSVGAASIGTNGSTKPVASAGATTFSYSASSNLPSALGVIEVKEAVASSNSNFLMFM